MKLFLRALIALCILFSAVSAYAETAENLMIISCAKEQAHPGSSAYGMWHNNKARRAAYNFAEFRDLFAKAQGIKNTETEFRHLPTGIWCVPTPVAYSAKSDAKIITLTLVRGNDGLYHPMKTVAQKPKKEVVVPTDPVVKQNLASAPVQEEWHPKLLPTTLPKIDTLAQNTSFGFKLNRGVVLVILVAMLAGVLVWLALGGFRNSRRPHHIIGERKVDETPTLSEHMDYQKKLQDLKLQLAQEKYSGDIAAEKIKTQEKIILFLQEELAETKHNLRAAEHVTMRIPLPDGWVHVNGGSVTYVPLLNVSLWDRLGISAAQVAKDGIPVAAGWEIVFLKADPKELDKQLAAHPHLARELGVKQAA